MGWGSEMDGFSGEGAGGKRGVARKKKKGTGCDRYRTYYEEHVWEGERESQRESERRTSSSLTPCSTRIGVRTMREREIDQS